MKKSLIALAALAVVSAASAQSSLSITGYVDRGYTELSSSKATDNLKTVGSSAGTTYIFMKGSEDLGGGNTAGFFVETDFTELDGNTQKSSYSAAQNAGFANGESYVSLASAQLGSLKLGAVNNFTYQNAAQVATNGFGTGVGSSYGSKFTIANGIGTGTIGNGGAAILATNGASNTVTAGSRAIRLANTIQYSSPVYMGFVAGVSYVGQNNNVVTSNGNGNTVGATEYSLRYQNGPLEAAFTSIKYSVGSNGTSQNTATTGTAIAAPLTLAGGLTSTQNLLAVSYMVLPQLKLNGGYGTFSSSDNLSKGTSVQVGATYVIGNIDLLAQYAKVDDTSALNVDRTMFGLGANYNLSKTARVYFRYEDVNYASNTAAFDGSKVKRTAVGVSKSF